MDNPMDKLSSHYNELLDGDVTDMTSFSDSTSFDTTDDSSSQYQPSLENQEQQQSTNDSDSSLLESGSDTMWIGNALEGAIDLTTPRPVPEEETFGDKPLEKDSETSTEDKTGDKYLDADMDGHLETTGSDANGRGPGNNQDQQLEQGSDSLDFGNNTAGVYHSPSLDSSSDHNLTLSYGIIGNSSQQNHHQNNTLTTIGSRYVNELETVDLSYWLVGAIIVLFCLRLPYIKRTFMKLSKNQESEPSVSPTLPYHVIPTKELD